MRTIFAGEEAVRALEARHVVIWLEWVGLLGPIKTQPALAAEWRIARGRVASLVAAYQARRWFRLPFVVVHEARGRLPGKPVTIAQRMGQRQRCVRKLHQMGLLGPAKCPHCGRPWG